MVVPGKQTDITGAPLAMKARASKPVLSLFARTSMGVVFPAPGKRIVQRGLSYFRKKNGDARLGPSTPNSCPGSTRPLIPSRIILSSAEPLEPPLRSHPLVPCHRGTT